MRLHTGFSDAVLAAMPPYCLLGMLVLAMLASSCILPPVSLVEPERAPDRATESTGQPDTGLSGSDARATRLSEATGGAGPAVRDANGMNGAAGTHTAMTVDPGGSGTTGSAKAAAAMVAGRGAAGLTNIAAAGAAADAGALPEPMLSADHEWADWHMPTTIPGAATSQSLVSNADGTTTDSVTKLMWHRNTQVSLAECTRQISVNAISDQIFVPIAACTWDEAARYCSSLDTNGAGLWRMPTKIEVASTIDETTISSPMNRFDNYASNGDFCFWTASTFAGSTDSAWTMHSRNLSETPYSKNDACRVVCVSSN